MVQHAGGADPMEEVLQRLLWAGGRLELMRGRGLSTLALASAHILDQLLLLLLLLLVTLLDGLNGARLALLEGAGRRSGAAG